MIAGAAEHRPHFLGEPRETADALRLAEEDRTSVGFVMNVTRLWTHAPALQDELFSLIGSAARLAGLDVRRRAILVVATATARRDSYCTLAWGGKLAAMGDERLPVALIDEMFDELEERDRVLAEWACAVVRSPNDTTLADIEGLRRAGFHDAQILAITLFVALRLAFSTVNDALGAVPDEELVARAPAVVQAIDFGRPPIGTTADRSSMAPGGQSTDAT